MSTAKDIRRVASVHDQSVCAQTGQLSLMDLPSELLAQILGHTSGGTVLRLSSCGKVFRDVARNNQVWKQLRDQRRWRPSPGVADIIKANAYRDAYQVQVMEKKLSWDNFGALSKRLDCELHKLACQAPTGRRGCVLSVPTTSLRRDFFAQKIQVLQDRQAAIAEELVQEHLSITDKGWKRQWG